MQKVYGELKPPPLTITLSHMGRGEIIFDNTGEEAKMLEEISQI